MYTKVNSEYIRCYFSKKDSLSSYNESDEPVEIYFAETGKIENRFASCKNYVTEEEQKRSDRFYSRTYQKTYLFSHALLRLILAKKLEMDPGNLTFYNDKNDKPQLKDNKAYFNISHTRDSFAIAIARDFPVGIDLEGIKDNINYRSIIKNYFGKKEREYILHSESKAIEKFYLLWTRKEALLKAIGTGLTNNLDQIGLSEPENYIDIDLFRDIQIQSNKLTEYFIYSKKIKNNYLSVAVPARSPISYHELNEHNNLFHVGSNRKKNSDSKMVIFSKY